jgi:hypothetical protein
VNRLVLLLALAIAAATATSSHAAKPNCAAPLPTAPSGLPSAVVLQTDCGAYRLDGGGTVSTTPSRRWPWWTPSPFQIALRRHHVVLIENGTVRWRSRHVFEPDLSELGSVAVGRRDLAFGFAKGRLWVSRLDGREHAFGWNEGALAWTKNDELLTSRRHHGATELLVRRENGSGPRLIARRPLNYAVEESGSVVYATQARVLVRSDGSSKITLADLGALGFGRWFELQLLSERFIAVSTPQRIAILNQDGSVLAATRLPAIDGLSYGYPSFAAGSESVAFALPLWDSASVREREDVFALRAGDSQPQLLLSEETQLFAGCGWSATLEWHQNWLLYADALTNVVALDTAGGGRVDLSATAQDLPGVAPDPSGDGLTGFQFAVWG